MKWNLAGLSYGPINGSDLWTDEHFSAHRVCIRKTGSIEKFGIVPGGLKGLAFVLLNIIKKLEICRTPNKITEETGSSFRWRRYQNEKAEPNNQLRLA